MIIQMILLTVLLHLIADYTLQGCLANLKQRKWWIETGKANGMSMQEITKYKHDYKCGLLCHSLYWTLVTFFPIIFLSDLSWAVISFIALINTAIHYEVDDMKANQGRLTLWQDQGLHLLQIVLTCVLFTL